MTPADRDALRAMVDSIGKVRAYVRRAGPAWTSDGMAVDAIAKRLEEIGELAKRLSPAAIYELPGVDWRGVKGMREILVHDYGHVQIKIIESVVRDELDDLERAITTLPGDEPVET